MATRLTLGARGPRRRFVVGALLLVFVATGLGLDYRHALEQPVWTGSAPRLFAIARGERLAQLGEHLVREGFSLSPIWLQFQAWRQGARVRFGEYQIEPGTTLSGLLTLFASGKVHLHALTLIEGWSFRQVRDALDASSVLEHTLAGVSESEVMKALGLPDGIPEGQFFPDTYFFARGDTDREILRQAYARQRRILDVEWAGRGAVSRPASPEEALILASLVEKEAARADDRPRIAGVFLRRLETGMRLQTDPAVIYGLGVAYDGDLDRGDLKHASPYNTYLNPGLPPTPIALAGRAALNAVLHPEAGDALYFVARGDGSHEFSATLAQHNRAVRRWQKIGGRP